MATSGSARRGQSQEDRKGWRKGLASCGLEIRDSGWPPARALGGPGAGSCARVPLVLGWVPGGGIRFGRFQVTRVRPGGGVDLSPTVALCCFEPTLAPPLILNGRLLLGN